MITILRVIDSTLTIIPFEFSINNTSCKEERGYKSFTEFNKSFIEKNKEKSDEKILQISMEGDAYTDIKNHQSIFKIDEQIEAPLEKELTYSRLFESPAIHFSYGRIGIKIHLKEKLEFYI